MSTAILSTSHPVDSDMGAAAPESPVDGPAELLLARWQHCIRPTDNNDFLSLLAHTSARGLSAALAERHQAISAYRATIERARFATSDPSGRLGVELTGSDAIEAHDRTRDLRHRYQADVVDLRMRMGRIQAQVAAIVDRCTEIELAADAAGSQASEVGDDSPPLHSRSPSPRGRRRTRSLSPPPSPRTDARRTASLSPVALRRANSELPSLSLSCAESRSPSRSRRSSSSEDPFDYSVPFESDDARRQAQAEFYSHTPTYLTGDALLRFEQNRVDFCRIWTAESLRGLSPKERRWRTRGWSEVLSVNGMTPSMRTKYAAQRAEVCNDRCTDRDIPNVVSDRPDDPVVIRFAYRRFPLFLYPVLRCMTKARVASTFKHKDEQWVYKRDIRRNYGKGHKRRKINAGPSSSQPQPRDDSPPTFDASDILADTVPLADRAGFDDLYVDFDGAVAPFSFSRSPSPDGPSPLARRPVPVHSRLDIRARISAPSIVSRQLPPEWLPHITFRPPATVNYDLLIRAGAEGVAQMEREHIEDHEAVIDWLATWAAKRPELDLRPLFPPDQDYWDGLRIPNPFRLLHYGVGRPLDDPIDRRYGLRVVAADRLLTGKAPWDYGTDRRQVVDVVDGIARTAEASSRDDMIERRRLLGLPPHLPIGTRMMIMNGLLDQTDPYLSDESYFWLPSFPLARAQDDIRAALKRAQYYAVHIIPIQQPMKYKGQHVVHPKSLFPHGVAART